MQTVPKCIWRGIAWASVGHGGEPSERAGAGLGGQPSPAGAGGDHYQVALRGMLCDVTQSIAH
jgi:hypothetical protein